MGKDENGNPRQEISYTVTENGQEYRWNVPIKNKEGGANYLIERLMDIREGDTVLLEMKRRGPRNYVDVQKVGDGMQDHSIADPVDDDEEFDPDNLSDDQEAQLQGSPIPPNMMPK